MEVAWRWKANTDIATDVRVVNDNGPISDIACCGAVNRQ